ncbi:MAG TPA: phosphatase PAP2 family protein [Terriglobia bacterium]|nr:phosphatase PAP2 family protein [Terriglobia bacterium]
MQLPPYGNLTEQHLGARHNSVFVPGDWRVPKGDGRSTEEHYDVFLADVKNIIREVLWPEFKGGQWLGDPSAAEELTRLDLDLMASKLQVLDNQIQFQGKPIPDATTHRELFLKEDVDPEPFGAEYEEYEPKVKFEMLAKIIDRGREAQNRKVGWSIVQMKKDFQRPRPYQASLVLNPQAAFLWQEAVTSLTPSIPSGHSLQGMLHIGCAMEQILKSGQNVPDELLQYTVDIGDRRVFAGVHYPSDNLASWIWTLLSAPFVFRHPGVKSKLWEAIARYSLVYREIKSVGALYEPALKALEAASDSK